jgi:predicted nucleic acid-binding protein
MPRFYQEVEAEVDIDVEDFVYECSDRDIEKLIKCLVEEDKLPKTLTTYSQSQNLSVNDVLWYETISKIQGNRLAMTDEEIEIIEKIAKRF